MTSFYDRFAECAARFPDNTALEIQRREHVESYTYLQVKTMAESVGQWLAGNGLHDGARIAILADNHPRWVACYLGIIASGCTAVPLDTAFHADQVTKLLKDSGSSLLFCDVKHVPIAVEAVAGVPVELVLMNPAALGSSSPAGRWVSDLDAIFAGGPGNFTPQAVGADDVAAILYTSGTTADPKGVMLTYGNLMGEAAGVFGVLKLGPEDSVLGILPLFHSLAQMGNLFLPLVAGACVVYLETLNTTELLRALQERQITAFAVVPQFFYLIHERVFKEIAAKGKFAGVAVRRAMAVNRFLRRFGLNGGKFLFARVHAAFGTRMRYLVTGGSRFEPQIGRDFYALGIDILQAYGLTETCGGAFLTPPGENVIGSVGKPLPGNEGKIADPKPQEEGGIPVGEILIRGPIVMKGYWNRPDATSAVLKDGWLHTGDVGYFDPSGNLFITGRQKDVIVLSNGKNVYPEEVEAHYQHSPFIKEICVMGLGARPGDPMSERLHGVIVPDFQVLKERKIVNAKEVIRFDVESLSAKLPSTKRIASYEIWQEDLPRTTTRKLKRFEIEKRVRAKQGKSGADADISQPPLTSEDEAWLELPDVRRGLTIVREAARNKPESLRPDDNLELDLGLDSMQRVELLTALENELGGDVEESRISEIYTVRELIDFVRESAASGTVSPVRSQFAGWRNVLQEEPTDPDVLALAKPQPLIEAAWFFLSRLVGMFAYDRFQLKVTGLEKLPAKGPYIISSNHQSFLDPVILGSVLPGPIFKDIFSVGTSEIFGSGSMRRLARWLRVIVVDPDANLIPAMRAGAFGLRQGRVLILYPEGERSIDGIPKTFKKGAAILSIHLQVPIVPVAIEGFHEAWPRGKAFHGFEPLKIRFGDPLLPPPEANASEATYAELTSKLKARVVSMWEQMRPHEGRARSAAAD
jgi:long-chain acyl-CoA synthetase